MPSVSFDVGFQMLKAEIPENCIKSNHIIEGPSRIKLTQEAREVQKQVFDDPLLGWKLSLWWVLKKKAKLSEEDFPDKTENLKKNNSFGNLLYSL